MPNGEKEGQVQITLPPGMSAEDFQKAFASFQKSRIATQVRDKAVRAATKRLVDLHKPEYDKYLAEETKKVS